MLYIHYIYSIYTFWKEGARDCSSAGNNCPVHLWLRKMVVYIKDTRTFQSSPKQLGGNILQKPMQKTKFTKFMIILKTCR